MGKVSFHLRSILLFSVFMNCSIFQMNKYNGFGEWYFGRPGLKNTYEILNPEDECFTDNKDIIVRIEEERHRFFLHFRLPEIIINPQGGFYFPKVSRDCIILNERGEKGMIEYITSLDIFLLERGNKSGKKFNVTQGGLPGIIDTFIPYRLYTSKDIDVGNSMGLTFFTTILGFGQFIFIFYIEIPVYFVHDVLKTATIPFAGIYYLNQDKNIEEEKVEDKSDYSKFKQYSEFLKTHKK